MYVVRLPFIAWTTVCVLTARADFIITPGTPTTTVAPDAGSTLAGLVDGAGLSAAVTTGMDVAAAMVVTHANDSLPQNFVSSSTGNNSDYFSSGPAPVFTFTLGSAYNGVNSIVLWNYAAGTGVAGSATNNALKNFDLQFYADAPATTLITSVSALAVGRSFPVSGTGAGPQVAQRITFAAVDNVQAIKLTLTDNYFGFAGGGGGDRVGLAEVRFTAVPESSTYGLLGAAAMFGVAAMRRRRRI